MHLTNRRWTLLALPLLAITMGMGGGGGGCQPGGDPPPDLQPLAGLYQITRGDVRVTFAGASSSGQDMHSGSSSGVLTPVNVDDFPEWLRPLAQQWNDGLAALNAELDQAFPDQVVIEFPRFFAIRLTDAADATATVEGLINGQLQFLVAGDLSGKAEGDDTGGGAVLSLASIDGQFNADAKTVVGKVARTVLLLLGGQQGGLAISVQISVDYTGQRIGDVPTSQPAP
ncbi:MAG: hypothetical protein U1A27_13075 [Phycisphaerae bacterium]